MVCENACAKINLALDIKGRLENGYHELDMIMQELSAADRLEMEETEDREIIVKVEGRNISKDKKAFIPQGKDNTVYRAAEKLMEYAGLKKGVYIRLIKEIPVCAGLGGGSADAAAALRGMNRLFGLNLTDAELVSIGMQIGADVPFCILGGCRRAGGIGERLTGLDCRLNGRIVLVKPGVSVSTKEIFQKYDHAGKENTRHPDIEGCIKALYEKDSVLLKQSMGNVLENVTGKEVTVIGKIEKMLEKSGAVAAMMSGSGPTVFGIFDDNDLAKRAAAELKAEKDKMGIEYLCLTEAK